jgi:hypothetical protein
MSLSLRLAEVLSMSSGFLGMCFETYGINGPRLEMGQWLNSDCRQCLSGVRI